MNPEARKYWAVRFWWNEHGNLCETGGHFGYTEGDVPMQVLEDIAKGRKVDLQRCTDISIRLEIV